MKTLNLDSSVINQTKPKPEVIIEKPADPHPSNTPVTQKKSLKKMVSNIFQSISSWFSSLSPVQKIFIVTTFCIVFAGLGGFGIYRFIILGARVPDITFPTVVSAQISSQPPIDQLVPLPKPSAPRDFENPINGSLFTKEEYNAFSTKYPIAVMIENHVDTRPQSGYNSADLVFEALVEGGITRTMAIFWSTSVPEIGPIRSARQYYIEWMLPFDPLYMHIGYAISSDPKVNAGGSLYSFDVKSLDRGGTFWRSSERYAPHNAYSSTDLLYKKAEVYGYTGTPSVIEPWSFKRDAPLDQRGGKTVADFSFFDRLTNGGLYDITWTYDRSQNIYFRSNGTTPYTDANIATQVYAKNVIIQRVETISTYDEKAHMIITTIGSGDAIILRDGVVISATWKKTDARKRTHFYDSDGTEIQFNRGITWIEAVPIDQGSVNIDS